MKCIVNIKSLNYDYKKLRKEIEDENKRCELVREIFHMTRMIYDESANVSDAYLYDDDVGENDCVFGFYEPKKMIHIAERWNSKITNDFDYAVRAVLHRKEESGAYPTDDLLTYALKKAAMALDNSFYAFADYATATKPEQYYFKTLLSDEDIVAIRECPEDFVCIEVEAK